MESPKTPHVVVLPFPAQGHIKPMLILAELLSSSNFHITFVNSHHNQARLERSTDLAAFRDRFPSFRFVSVADGLPPGHPRSGPAVFDLFASTRAVTKPEFRELLVNMSKGSGGQVEAAAPTCIVADGIMSFAVDIGEELGVPVIAFRTFSATCTWTYFHLSHLVEAGEVPIRGDFDRDQLITCIPGLEGLLRRGDLPSICKFDADDPTFQFIVKEAATITRASGLILNTFDWLEADVISKLGSLFDKIYTIGPLHGLLDTFITKESAKVSSSKGILWREDTSCLKWLDLQPSKSVIYVSFGSVVSLNREQLLEFWYGLVNSNQRFLWVIRSNLLLEGEGLGDMPLGLEAATKERGCIVSWAPQEDVLAHSAVGGFLTHSGWNSTCESILAGVPMICWPQFADQPVNSRTVSHSWKIGNQMISATLDRSTVEKAVRDLVKYRREEIIKSVDEIAKMARDSVKEGSSSYANFVKLVGDMMSMSLGPTQDSFR